MAAKVILRKPVTVKVTLSSIRCPCCQEQCSDTGEEGIFVCHQYTQHRFNGTPAVHDHAHVGVRSQPAATSSQSPSCPNGMSGTPFTNDITGYPLGVTRTLSPSACT